MDITIQNNDAELFTTVQLNKDKETVILLHGGPGVPDGLTFVANFLAQDFQVISFHQRGTRKSPVFDDNYSLNRYLSDIDCLADYFNLAKFHLFGHSWGGLYAQVYADKNQGRIRSLFLCSPGSGTGRQWKDTVLEIARYNKIKCSLREWIAMGIYSALGILGSDKAYQNFYRQVVRNFSRGFPEAHPGSFRIDCVKATAVNKTTLSILRYPLLPALTNPDFKITITYGDKDIYGESTKYVKQRYPTAAIFTIPASGHLPWSHNEKAFVKILAEHYRIKKSL
jgi:proline iminopeptidase